MEVEKEKSSSIKTLNDLAKYVNYSLINTLNSDPNAKSDGVDYYPREVLSGHYVSVKPTPITNPIYVSHSKEFFAELGFDDSLVSSQEFISMFSGDTSKVPLGLNKLGWATGYALSIYGTEYYNQCPFQTGNAYGDGRAISIFEGILQNKRWEMQLKGGGKTPYCRGADGKAVLRSSVREFLAQEHMHALGIPSSRSLSLFTSKNEQVQRPWYSKGSHSFDPDIMVYEDVAITTRVAPSFLRVGQIELFARRARKNEHVKAMEELEMIVLHVIEREYYKQIDESLSLEDKVIVLAKEFCARLTSLVTNWIRVGYCQGNFNSDNTAVGGFTLDYGPFGFMELFDPKYQSWTGGGRHFAFFNQIAAAQRNFHTFCKSLHPLIFKSQKHELELEKVAIDFSRIMSESIQKMWADKLGCESFDSDLFEELQILMEQTGVDYTIFFRELSNLPKNIEPLRKSFYGKTDNNMNEHWVAWHTKWLKKVVFTSEQMKKINPKYILREWILVDAYTKAKEGDYTLIRELQDIMNKPYAEQSKQIEDKYYKLKPIEFFEIGGVSHVSCSS